MHIPHANAAPYHPSLPDTPLFGCHAKNRGTFTYHSGIAEETGLSHSSVSRVIEPLLAIEIITEKKVGKQIRTFTLDEENPVTKLLLKFYGDLSELLPE